MVPSDDTATIETGPLDQPGRPSVPIIRPPKGLEIVNVPSPPPIGPEGIGPVVCPLASINTAFLLSNATRSGMNEEGVGVGDGVATTEPLVDAGEDVGDPVGEDVREGVAAPQAARAAALAITRAVGWIRIEWFLSCFGVCLLNDQLFAWLRD
jgi:hypothetical protein